ncbi:FAD-dependent oxidoreductase [Streptomyces paludis]|uniref:FAD-dependent monooxygenase n=1 Tax=Streptomyces paludis TaxID=2282738 RepID=A0A345HS55_9ACTN|nr:NAD(P)/FAD-dependent oxidoreductase [Streptomyces paludis]AXG79529.1 FAD-dependent monooxygenase [Streptomyces paludis]
MTYDVVVCGAGVGGLLCAHALGARGLRVLLLEKLSAPVPLAKGEVLQPSSLPILRELGLLPRLVERGAVELSRLVVRGADGASLLAFDYSGLEGSDRTLLALDYAEILDVFGEALPETVTCRRGATVTELLRDPAGRRVTGVGFTAQGDHESAIAPLVVAADGVSSRLRKLAGIAAQPVRYGHRLVSFELSGVESPAPEVTAYMTPGGLRLFYPLPGDRGRLYVQMAPESLRRMNRAEPAEWCAAVCTDTAPLAPLRERLRNCVGTRQVHTVWRFSASRLTVPGMALVGESAHSVHPMAAQGMNTAIADARTLADQFTSGPLAPDAVDDALVRYEAQRGAWIRHIDLMSHDATRMVTSTSRAGRAFGRHVLRRMGGNPRLRHIATHNLAGYGMRPFTVLDRLHQVGLPDLRSAPV